MRVNTNLYEPPLFFSLPNHPGPNLTTFVCMYRPPTPTNMCYRAVGGCYRPPTSCWWAVTPTYKMSVGGNTTNMILVAVTPTNIMLVGVTAHQHHVGGR